MQHQRIQVLLVLSDRAPAFKSQSLSSDCVERRPSKDKAGTYPFQPLSCKSFPLLSASRRLDFPQHASSALPLLLWPLPLPHKLTTPYCGLQSELSIKIFPSWLVFGKGPVDHGPSRKDWRTNNQGWLCAHKASIFLKELDLCSVCLIYTWL